MLKFERQQRILDLLGRGGAVAVSDLEQSLGVSAFTIRRDLDELAEAGRLHRVRGGAVPSSTTPARYASRGAEHAEAKRRVAAAAITLLKADQTVIVDGGSTALALVEAIPADHTGTFITHSPPVATALGRLQRSEVLCVGGTLDQRAMVCVGPGTVGGYQRLHADLCFLGVWSIHAEQGLTEGLFEEAAVRRAILAAADRVVGLCSPDKLGTVATYEIGPAAALTHLAIDDRTPAELIKPFVEIGLAVLR
jgi:DeoR/GlpR family transcriptional regulator of sugar metabolism